MISHINSQPSNDYSSAPQSNTAATRHFSIEEWLQHIEVSNRRQPADKTVYTSLIPNLLEAEVYSTMELIVLGSQRLQAIASIKEGTAMRLIAWACEDCNVPMPK
jgi:hypothetical protein